MSVLEVYRDDGSLAGRILRRRAAEGRPLAWLVPPLLRLVEYGVLIALTAAADPGALPVCFAFLAVLAFHHYDTVYRLQHQRLAPPAWVRAAGGGWDGRLLVAAALSLAGGLRLGLVAAAIALGLLYLVESTVSWIRFGRAEGPVLAADEDEVGE